MGALRSVRYSVAPLMLAAAMTLPCAGAYAAELDQGAADLPDSAQDQVALVADSALPGAGDSLGSVAASDNGVAGSADAAGEGADAGASAAAGGAASSADVSGAGGQTSAAADPAAGNPEGSAAAAASPSTEAASDPSGTQDADAAAASLATAGSSANATGWVENGSAVRYYDADGSAHVGWLVTDTYKAYGLQRYWFDSDGLLAFSQLIDAANAGWWAYATEYGYVVRGRYTDSATGYVYLADNDGRLEDAGWLVTDAYGQGLQRYYIDADAHAAKPGYSADGWDHCTTSEGYVARGAYATGGLVYLADNDGRLSSADGWLVSDAFGQGLQRYYICADKHAAVQGFSDDGWAHYTTSEGYVMRGKLRVGAGMLLANNDGQLVEATASEGWLVTDAYDGHLQRYRIDRSCEGHLGAHLGFFTIDESEYYGHYSQGYVLRGKQIVGSGMLLADNDGVLVGSVASEGWLVTDKYDGELQRYRIDGSCEGHLGAHLGYFELGGNGYYGRYDTGYVVRNVVFTAPDGNKYYGNNDGVLGALPIVNLDVPCFNQYEAGLPTGCESAALTCVLRYYGFDLGDCTMADDWIPRSDWDFVWSFWGNPHSYSGVMICSPGIVNAANNFLSSCGSNLRAYNVSGSSLYDLRNYLYDGNPVIIWTSDHQEELSDPAAWQDGYTFYPGTHTVVLKGYNPDTDEVYLCDTIDGYTTWDRSYLEGIFATNGQQAVVIK